MQLASGDATLGQELLACASKPSALLETRSCSEAIHDKGERKDHSVKGGPSAATFSRARIKLDILMMMARQRHWNEHGFDSHWVSLCTGLRLRYINLHLSYYRGLSLRLQYCAVTKAMMPQSIVKSFFWWKSSAPSSLEVADMLCVLLEVARGHAALLPCTAEI